MRPSLLARAAVVLTAALALGAPDASRAGRPRPPSTHESVGFQMFASPQSNPIILSPDQTRLYVANTTSGTVSVLNATSLASIATVTVGVEPVGLAVRPDGLQVWVSNHVSDSVSVIDTNPASPKAYQVIETIQDFDAAGATLFDEPVGIAFASNTKAYVALSSRDDIAVIDATTYEVTSRIHVTAQEPRAIAVRNGLLYVAAFESGNRTQMSSCGGLGDDVVGSGCSLGIDDIAAFAVGPNIPNNVKNIVVDSGVPDRDLFVYDTANNQLVEAVTDVGTLLYGLAVSSTGQVFISQTDARNDVNGDHGQHLIDLDNRMFLDEIATTSCSVGGGCGAITVFDLHAAAPPPSQPAPGTELSTPYGLAISADDQWLVGTSAGNSRAFLMTAGGDVTARVDLGQGAELGQQIPRGVALRSKPSGKPLKAYVLNTLESTVAVVDVVYPAPTVQDPDPDPTGLELDVKVGVGADATPANLRRGAIAFHSSLASSSGTFSCASCHPDGNTDQLLWRIGGDCAAIGCDSDGILAPPNGPDLTADPPADEPRTTMPVRGLRDTLPLHWDGSLGDPVGGRNGATAANLAPVCNTGGVDGDLDCFRHLVDASLSGVMCDQTGGCDVGPSGIAGALTAQERDDMAAFLGSVVYPPARSRRMNDLVSGTGIYYGAPPAADPVTFTNPVTTLTAPANALEGFKDFFTNQGGLATDPDTCADASAGCHALPLGVVTNSSTLDGFDAPTMRGLTDRFVQFSLAPATSDGILLAANNGITIPAGAFGNPNPIPPNPLEAPIKFAPATEGMQEITSLGGAFLLFRPVYGTTPMNTFQMVEEASTGFPGATGRQVTLNDRTTAGGLLAETTAVLAALEEADADGMVNLRGVGPRDTGAGLGQASTTTLSFRSNGLYTDTAGTTSLTRAQLIAEAQNGDLVMTFTGALRSGYGVDPQPLLSPPASGGCTQCGDPAIPVVTMSSTLPTVDPPAFNVRGEKLTPDASVVWDGAGVSGATLACASGGTFPSCTNSQVAVNLPTPRPSNGLHLLQVRNGDGPLSNEVPVCVRTSSGASAVCQ